MDPAHASAALSSRHLVFDRDNFADFWAALTVRVRRDNYADLVYSGEFPHPLLAYQQTHAQLFQQHGVPVLTAAGIDMDPLGIQHRFLTIARQAHGQPFAASLQALEASFVTYRQAQRYIYTNCVECLRVGSSMHYVRAVPFGAGTQLMRNIYDDNNRSTNMSSLMTLFKTI